MRVHARDVYACFLLRELFGRCCTGVAQGEVGKTRREKQDGGMEEGILKHFFKRESSKKKEKKKGGGEEKLKEVVSVLLPHGSVSYGKTRFLARDLL